MENIMYMCERCGFQTTLKGSLVRHLQNKRVCRPIESEIDREELLSRVTHREYKTDTTTCEFCEKTISKPVIARHKKTCKLRLETIPKNIEHDTNNNNDTLHKLKDVLEMHEDEIQSLKECVMYFKDKLENDHMIASTSKQHTEQHKLKKKSKISQAIRIVCWNTYIGEEIGKSSCLCCKSNHITQHNFHCGHVIAEANGGKIQIENLRPICAVCNNSMGTMNMKEFARDNFNVEI